MKAPVATYRVQLNKTFGFDDLKQIVPYFSKLGISHIYASPIFQAKKGSSHGYDVVDPNRISDELGGQAAFDSLLSEASTYGLEWLQDIVPNHVSYSLENKIIYDVMQKGQASKFSAFFDVDWKHPSPRLHGKILAPFLSEPYNASLKHGLISLTQEDGAKVNYKGMLFPLNASILEKPKRYNQDIELLDKLLSAQYYSLEHWKIALKRINYRRFFDIIDLIGVQVERPAVFEATHRLILQLANTHFSGLRVDHIDGLYNPEEYLKKLRERLPDAYLIVEKILTEKEQLPDPWPVQGTTGYDFLGCTNKLFISQASEAKIDTFYRQFTGCKQDFSELLYESKKLVIQKFFCGDVQNLSRLISQTLRKTGFQKQLTQKDLRLAVVELLTSFQVYRTYLNPERYHPEAFKAALRLVEQKNPQLTDELEAIDYLLEQSKNSPQALHAIMRLQQFTGPVMAKGFEDTAFYRYSRFISINEVGSNPAVLGLTTDQFNTFNHLRKQKWPLSMNASSTHDSKRGEDVRARLNVLSEIADEYIASVKAMANLNSEKRHRINGKFAPDRAEENYLYQTLLGAYPWGQSETQEFTSRLKLHMIKALREAKKNSSWLSPRLIYEQAVQNFIDEVLGSQSFMQSFLSLQRKVAFYGFFNTLAQTLLKITCPGVPDFYQGTELWALNLVDPDNRRPVNFQTRQKALIEIASLNPSQAPSLLEDFADGKAKLYVIYKALELRRKMKELFWQGEYIPLEVKGACSENVVAFCRKKADLSVLVIVPRFLTQLIETGSFWRKAQINWKETSICPPQNFASAWTDAFTNKKISLHSGLLPICDALDNFPVALLFSGDLNG